MYVDALSFLLSVNERYKQTNLFALFVLFSDVCKENNDEIVKSVKLLNYCLSNANKPTYIIVFL